MGSTQSPPAWRGVVALFWVLGCALTPAAFAEEPAQESALHIGRLHYDGGGDWYSNPSSLPNWMRAF